MVASGANGLLMSRSGATSSWAVQAGWTDGYLQAVAAAGPNSAWAVGPGQSYFWDGTRWTRRPPPGGSWLYGVDGTAADNAWAVGSGPGRLLRWTGSAGTFEVVVRVEAAPLNANNPHYAVLEVSEPGQGVGLANPGFDGIRVEAGERYRLANDLAARLAARMLGRGAAEVRGILRRFYRAGQTGKIEVVRAA